MGRRGKAKILLSGRDEMRAEMWELQRRFEKRARSTLPARSVECATLDPRVCKLESYVGRRGYLKNKQITTATNK